MHTTPLRFALTTNLAGLPWNKKIIHYLIIISITLTGVFLFYTPTHAEIIFKSDYEKGNFAGWISDERCCSYSSQIVTSPVRAGKYAARFEVRDADPKIHNGKRSEVYYKDNRIGNVGGRDEWYGFSIYLPPDYKIDDDPRRWLGMGTGEILAQWHDGIQAFGTEVWRMPVLALYTDLGKWKWLTSYSSIPIETTTERKYVYHWEEPYKTGIWTDWVIHVKWSYKSDGFLEIWKDGKKIVNYTGPNVYNTNIVQKPIFFKWGIYKAWWNNGSTHVTKRVVYNDEFRIGDSNSSYAEVAPRVPDTMPPSQPTLTLTTTSAPSQ